MQKMNRFCCICQEANNGGSSSVTSVSKTILALKKRLLPESVAIPLYLNQTLFAVQEGLTLGIWIKDSYYDASGLSSLSENKSALDSAGKRKYESKMHTATAFMLFATAYKIVHDLKPHASDDLSVMKAKICRHSRSFSFVAFKGFFLQSLLL